MKLFKVITVLISLAIGTASANEWSKSPNETNEVFGTMPYPQLFSNDILYSMMTMGFSSTQYMSQKLTKQEKKLHESAVFFMLENAPNSKIVSWYSKNRLANGKVRVIHSYPVGGGFCRTYQAYIKISNKERHTTNIACKESGFESWRFYK